MEDLVTTRYSSLKFSNIVGFRHALPNPEYYDEVLPIFDGYDSIMNELHVSLSQDFIDILAIEHEDTFMRFFHDSLEGGCKEWVINFPPRSIDFIHNLM